MDQPIKIKIICIVGDGRSGSTMLESILNNSDEVISVGECFRFWTRFYKNESLCGCGDGIAECDLWKRVHQNLSSEIPDYDIYKIKKTIRKFLLYRNFGNIQVGLQEVDFLLKVIRIFYKSISKISSKNIIIDSSKSPSWAKLLCLVEEFDVKIIHLERSLPHVASSWRKRILLQEFALRPVYMPVKSNLSVLRTWLRTKLLGSRLHINSYLFVKYEDLCNHPENTLSGIFAFLNHELDVRGPFYYKSNHAIAGNPRRMSENPQLIISPHTAYKPDNLNHLEYYVLGLLHKLINLIIR